LEEGAGLQSSEAGISGDEKNKQLRTQINISPKTNKGINSGVQKKEEAAALASGHHHLTLHLGTESNQ
jgi:hypothetical protein